MTSLLPPGLAAIKTTGDVFRQMGTSKVEATGTTEVTLTYTDNYAGVNAKALLNDTFRGAKLIVDNQSKTRDLPPVNGDGMAEVLKGVAGLSVTVLHRKGFPSVEHVSVKTQDARLAQTMSELLNPKPSKFVRVTVTGPQA